MAGDVHDAGWLWTDVYFNPFNCMLVGPLDPATHLGAPHSELISHKTGLKNCFQFYLFCLMPENNSLGTFGSYLLDGNFVQAYS